MEEVMKALSNDALLSSVKLNHQEFNADNIDKLNSSNNESKNSQEINSIEEIKKTLSFNDKTYQPTFQMQPEIVNPKGISMNDRQFVFGNAKVSKEYVIKDPAPKESLDLLKKSIESLKNREFGNFADNILQSASKLSTEKSQHFKEIKNKISSAELNEKLQSFGFKDIEISLKDIEELLEKILSNEHSEQEDENQKRYVFAIQKLCDILSILFGQFRDKIEVAATNKALDSIKQSEFVAEMPKELDAEDILNLNSHTREEPEKDISTEDDDIKGTEEMTVNGKKICKCFSMNNELDKQSDEAVYDKDIKTAKSVEFDAPEEENAVPLKSYNSLIRIKFSGHKLRKVKNMNDLSRVKSSTRLKSKSFIHSKGINDLPVELQTKYPIQSNVVQVSSIPSIITRYYHPENFTETFLTDSTHSIKCESISSAIIEDLNDDDGFFNLPKVPSSTLSEASSSEWIDANTSFVNTHYETVEELSEPILVSEIPKLDPLPIIPLESLCSVLNEPLLSALTNQEPLSLTHPQQTNIQADPQPSTSADSKPIKKQKRFSGCKNFVKRLIPNKLLRKKDRN
ncbi:unnamed protein product [Chironomus riparius]|uniref:Uncharacterized protein n=1 Tax=Chironomus riparius TaxID=315576 RepID=A0A9N9WUS8_9DIPT|nr:unnamed protein product [Chironomus riparius]